MQAGRQICVQTHAHKTSIATPYPNVATSVYTKKHIERALTTTFVTRFLVGRTNSALISKRLNWKVYAKVTIGMARKMSSDSSANDTLKSGRGGVNSTTKKSNAKQMSKTSAG